MNTAGYKQDQKIKTDFSQCILSGLKSILSKQLISLKLCVRENFPTFIEAVTKAAGRQSSPSAAVKLAELGGKGYLHRIKHLTFMWLQNFCCGHYGTTWVSNSLK